MALSSGTKLGPYEILSPLGVGGMGEVYRARDTKLNRDVALKVLPEIFAANAERMARFQREAQVLASLNHPNIAAIYGLEESGATRALVMELVEGETLADQLKSGAIRSDDALPVAKQIADALEYAHERGIIHRDLKPANVKVTPEGTVKVLDFGLAKALDPGATSSPTGTAPLQDSPTLTAAATQAGVILGTAAYMSPEQARGKTVDRRADIWAFGCVLYEMLTGKRPFEGETVTDVLAALVVKEPDWDALPTTTSASIQKLIRRCLTKDPKQRLRDIGEARITIEETISGNDSVAAIYDRRIPDVERSSPLQRALPWIVAAVALILGLAAGWWYGTRSTPAPKEWSGDLLPGPSIAFSPRVAPDGRLVAIQAMVDNLSQIGVLDPASGNWTLLTRDRTQGLIINLSWSRDGSKIYFDRFNPQPVGVFSIPVLGGEARELLSNATAPEELPDKSMILVRVDPDRRNQIYHYWPETGQLQALGAWVEFQPSVSLRLFPDGKEAVYFGWAKGARDAPHLYALDIATGNSRRLAPDLPITVASQNFALAVAPDGQSVLFDLPSGNLHRIVAIPRSGESKFRTVIDLTSPTWHLDVGAEGSLYVDQIDRPLQILKISPSGGIPDVLASIESYPSVSAPTAAELPDGRLVLSMLISGKPRLLLGKPGESSFPLLQGNTDASPPAASLGNGEVAFVAGSAPNTSLAIASVKEGRILAQFPETKGKTINSVAASPDGATVYYVSSGTVWAVPSQGGTPRKICDGDGVAVDPGGNFLIVNLFEAERVRLERIPLSGGSPQPIQVKGDLAISPVPLGGTALDKRGRLLVSVAPSDSWFFGLGILNVASGTLTRIPSTYTGDVAIAGWTDDGQILVSSSPLGAHIWRFRPVTSEK
ncbi:MAG TPA: protein kinase [Candidatus Polarisedimenticolia bacterium]|nr:protein kinase [Candidatus Polarisedimenticolia bacterium]